ncbi:putative ribonuclease H-like domain-containing protein [Tanacetum coccineum]
MATHCFSKKQLPGTNSSAIVLKMEKIMTMIIKESEECAPELQALIKIIFRWDFTLSSLLEWIIKTGKSKKMRRLFEFIWHGFSSLGSSSQIYIGTFPKHYGLPNGFRIEINDVCDPIKEKELILLMVKGADLEIRDPRIDQGVGSTSGIRACALRNFDLGTMELENSQNNALAKLPMLKLGEYEMWEIRIKQYFQIQDYALWEVIENGNSWVPIPVTAPESGPSTALKMTVPSTAEEKICKKNDVKARSLLLMALPNEHQLTFNQYVDAQSMFAAIKARFGGNEATKRTQKALLKQQYENFNASSSESLDSIFNRLQKLVSRLAILGVVTPPEDLNVKFLRSLPSEWDTHVVVWMNKPDFDTMGLDDLYNNFKIVEQKVKKSTADNNDDKNLAFLTTSSPSSTNTINTVNTGVSTGTTKVNTASTETSTASFSDATVYAFLSTQPQGSQLVHEDLEQIHDDDLEEMDLKWNMALLSMRARKFYQRTGRKIIIDGNSTAGYDKSKVECFNCHKMGHFARECRVPRSKDNRSWNQGNSSKTVRIEDASEKAMCAIDGGGFDWSDMAEDEIQANMALMAFSDSEVSCSKSCVLKYEALKKQYDDLLVKLDDTAFKASTYKRGLSILEAQVVKYKESEVLFSEEIALLKRSVGHKDYLMGLVKTELEKVKEEKEGVEFKLAKFEKSSKDLDDLLASQVTDKSKKGFGYNAVPSPHPLILNRPTPLDLSYSGLEEFQQPEINWYGPRSVNTGRPFSTGRSFNIVRPSYTAHPKSISNSARPKTYFQNQAQSTAHRPFYKRTALTNRCWVGDHQTNGASLVFNKYNYIDARGRSKQHSHLFDFKDFNGVMFSLEEEPMMGRISGHKNRVLIVKPHNKTPYELFRGFKPAIGFMKPFGCHVTILNTLDKLGKFDGKSDEEKSHDDCSLQNNGTVDQQVNTASPEVNTGSREVSTVIPEVTTASPEDLVGPIPTSEDTKRTPTDSNCKKGSEALYGIHPSTKRLYDTFAPHFFGAIAFKEEGLTNFYSSKDKKGISCPTEKERNFINWKSLGSKWNADDVDEHLYRSMIGSLMLRAYTSRLDICLLPKKTSWEQFSSNIATAVICLATNRRYNFSRMIFEHMVSNISSPHKFLMYPRFIQICLDMQRNQLQQHTRTYRVPSLTMKVFNNMKRHTKGYSGQEVALFPTMLIVPEPSTLPSRITSSPSHSPEPIPLPTPSPEPEPSPTLIYHWRNTQPSPNKPSPGARPPSFLYLMNYFHACSPTWKLEAQIKIGKARRRARIIHSNDEDIADDSSKQGRKLSDAEVQEKASNETEPVIQDVTLTEVIQDQESSENGRNYYYVVEGVKRIRTRKDKVKAIMTELEGPRKKLRKSLNRKEMKEVSKESGAKRKKSIPRKSTRKRQKIEEDAEKEELEGFLDIIPREDVPIEVEILSTQVFHLWIGRLMLEDFDRQDVEELYRLVKERYSASRPEGYDLMLWGDLHTLFEPDEEDELWKNQHEYNVISFKANILPLKNCICGCNF